MLKYPSIRMQRYRKSDSIRSLFSMDVPPPNKFVWPVFLVDGESVKDEISSMPNQYRYSIDMLINDLPRVIEQGINSILLFASIESDLKDEIGSYACSRDDIVNRAIPIIKKSFPSLTIITDVCLCAYTDHGHCAPLDKDGHIDNDRSLEQLSKIAVVHAKSGADMVAPSAMMDGQVFAIREALNFAGFKDVMIMSYSTKFASNLYGPFRDAENSAPIAGGRDSYQIPYDSTFQALRESQLDEQEGADILMVKPALFYLDIVSKVKSDSSIPVAVYNVSGEYSMLYAMADRGFGDLYALAAESLVSMKRAGADIIISYWSNQYNKVFGIGENE